MACPLCAEDGGALVWRGERLRVIRAQEAGFPAFYRVVWNAHVAEFSDLAAVDRVHCMEAVALVEQALRQHLSPTKVNIAALKDDAELTRQRGAPWGDVRETRWLITTMIEHDLYHAGEINHLRALRQGNDE